MSCGEAAMARPTIFIDGEHGTTGLQIRRRLEGRDDVEMVSIDPAKRKDEAERARMLNSVDVAVLCLPDDASRQAVAMIDNPRTRVLDGSSGHRVTPGWTYGFPELSAAQEAAIRTAARVSVPGCHATGAIALLRPLVDAGLLAPDAPVSVQGVQGYSGGGRQLVDAMAGKGQHRLAGPYRAYALEMTHKHQPEMKEYARLAHKPLFTPAVGNFVQGHLVQVPLHASQLKKSPTGADVHAVYAAHYAGKRFVDVMPFAPGEAAVLAPEALAGTNLLEVFVFENRAEGHILAVARFDNLGKGASGAAVQNLDLMLGLDGKGYDYALAPDAV
jgi:N-acetyl-gamma-glutamyl-phosphate reductase